MSDKKSDSNDEGNKSKTQTKESSSASSASSDLHSILTAGMAALHIPQSHATVGLSNILAQHKEIRTLWTHRRLPDHGWSDHAIAGFLHTLSTLDTNHKTAISLQPNNHTSRTTPPRWIGVGEREGRIYNPWILARHAGMSHGVGRSGDLVAAQPKAVGSTVGAALTTHLVLDAVRRGCGLNGIAAHGLVVPLCTGMTVALVLSAVRVRAGNEDRRVGTEETGAATVSAAMATNATATTTVREDAEPTATTEPATNTTTTSFQKNIVLWSRIDQKSCLKAIATAGLICVVVPTKRNTTNINDDSVQTDMDALTDLLHLYGPDRILAIVTTTSCFCPRIRDAVDQVAVLCQHHAIAHVINHAYGLQCRTTNVLLNRAGTLGRVDAVICSTDKNFLVPVGGAVVVSPSADMIQSIGKVYAGRASGTPVTDLCVTLLSMGLQGYRGLLEQRVALVDSFRARFGAVAEKYGERLLECPDNTISFGITLDGLARPRREDETDEAVYLASIARDISRFGAMLFHRCVSGTRVVPRGVQATVNGIDFDGFGSSVNGYPHAYLTAACAIGVGPAEVEEFFVRLDKTFREFHKQKKKKSKQQEQSS